MAVSPRLELIKLNHVNAIVDNYKSAVDHLLGVYDAQLNQSMPGDPADPDATDACLITIGNVIFDLFAPRRRGERGQGRLLDLYGDHYIGVEYQVPDVATARQSCTALGIRIINDQGPFFFTYPGSTLGISWELWDGDWHDILAAGLVSQLHPQVRWRDEHPLALDGLARITVAVKDLDAAVNRLTAVTGAALLDRRPRPHVQASGAELQVGDTVFELLAPTSDGPVASYLERYGERIRSTVFKATDLGQLEKHLAGKGVTLVPGDRDEVLAVRPEQNHNLLFEFTE